MDHGTRGALLDHLVAAVEGAGGGRPVRVAVDGAPAVGKTTLADELAVVLKAKGREVVRATIDDFLVPLDRRYRRGEYSGEGCYFDAHDHEALKRVLLDPLGPGGDRRYRTGVAQGEAGVDAVLLFDGVFLLRPELVDRWELRILVVADLARVVERAVVRERGKDGVERRWSERYLPAQRLYHALVDPEGLADIVVDNDEPQRPGWFTKR